MAVLFNRDARDIISVWTQFRKLGTLSFGKSAKSIRKILKLACGSDSEYFAHNADFPELRVTTLPAKFTQTEIMPRAVYWLFRKVRERVREYMFALWGGMWYDESEVMNFVVICSDAMLERIAVGRRMYHDCVCSWNGCGYD